MCLALAFYAGPGSKIPVSCILPSLCPDKIKLQIGLGLVANFKFFQMNFVDFLLVFSAVWQLTREIAKEANGMGYGK